MTFRILVALAVLAMPWALFAFTLWQFNPAHWPTEIRGMAAVFWVATVVMIVVWEE